MLRREEYDIPKLSAEERRALAERIFPVIRAVSPGESLEDFIADYGSDCWAMSMAVYLDQDQVVGYARYKIATRSIEGEDYKLLRLDITLLPGYRGKIPYERYYFKEAWRRREILRERNLYGLLLCLSPAPYYHVGKYYRAIYPRPGRHDAAQERRLERLLAAFGLSRTSGRPYTIKLLPRGFVEAEAEREGWRRHPSPLVRFYLEHCPGYHRGEALVAVAHLTAAGLLAGLWRLVADQLLKKLGLRRRHRLSRGEEHR
jgi:hypothetical protein